MTNASMILGLYLYPAWMRVRAVLIHAQEASLV